MVGSGGFTRLGDLLKRGVTALKKATRESVVFLTTERMFLPGSVVVGST